MTVLAPLQKGKTKLMLAQALDSTEDIFGKKQHESRPSHGVHPFWLKFRFGGRGQQVRRFRDDVTDRLFLLVGVRRCVCFSGGIGVCVSVSVSVSVRTFDLHIGWIRGQSRRWRCTDLNFNTALNRNTLS